jgi:hypothetical protein
MLPLWQGHEFDESSLDSWTFELVEAALALPPEKRDAFIARACEGSEALWRQVEAAVGFATGTVESSSLGGVCQPGDVVCDCLILRRIGQGGAGEVYKAIQRSLRRLVAVKVLQSIRDDHRLAFEREAARLAQLKSPRIVDVYEADFSCQPPAIAMEYVAGQSLRQWLSDRKDSHETRSDPTTIASIARQTCEALVFAHAHGIVHGDIKPENLLLSGVDDQWQVKVTDFGLARHVSAPHAGVMGTPGYLAPEQLDGAPSTPRSDIFSLGVVLYEMFVGRHPFAGSTVVETLANTLTREPEFDAGSNVPVHYRAVIVRALRKEPSQRYPSAAELLSDLTATPQSDDGENPFLSEFPHAIRSWLQRHSWGLPLAVASSLWGLLSLVFSVAAGAACVRVYWSAGDVRRFDIIYGYVVEPNAGPWYLVGVPVCIFAGCFFLHAAHVGLGRTAWHGTGDSSTAVEGLRYLAALNRRYFRWITPAILLSAIPFVLVPEVLFRASNAFGWVQADLAPRFVGMEETALANAGTITPLDSLREQCPGCELRVERVVNRGNRFHPPSRVWFTLFLATALTYEIVFAAFLWFISAKFVFFFWLLSRALLGTQRDGIRLVPDLEDRQDARFGLARLDNVYFATLTLLFLGALGWLAQLAANVHKGTNFFRGNAAIPLVGQPLLVLAVVGLTLILILVPLGIFGLLTIRIVDRERGRLSTLERQLQGRLHAAGFREARARIDAELNDVRERRQVLDRQRLLPTARPVFWWLLLATALALLAGPAAVAGPKGSGVVRAVGEALCAACGNAR